MKKNYLSDLISLVQLDHMVYEKNYFIHAGTGIGKSYFIFNTLAEYAKARGQKILYLVPRAKLNDQFTAQNVHSDVVCIMTYQAIEKQCVAHEEMNTFEYEYVVLDEYHYWQTDGEFNKECALSFEYVNSLENIKKIFISATPSHVIQKMLNGESEILFEQETNYDFVENVYMTHRNRIILEMASRLQNGEKVMYFTESVKDGLKMRTELLERGLLNSSDILFICSENNPAYKITNKESIEQISKYENFNERVLIATMALNVGVSIKDTAIKAIFLNVNNKMDFRQCVGRKRLQGNEHIDIYYLHDGRKIDRKLKLACEEEKKIDLFVNDREEYLRKYRTLDQNILKLAYYRDGELKENSLGRLVNKEKIKELSLWTDGLMTMRGIFLRQKINYLTNEFTLADIELDQFLLNSFVEKTRFITKEDKDLVRKYFVFSDKRGRKVKGSAKLINSYLEEINSEYRLEEKKTTKEGKNIRYWQVGLK